MKVKQLVRLLRDCDPEVEVVVYNNSTGNAYAFRADMMEEDDDGTAYPEPYEDERSRVGGQSRPKVVFSV